MGSPAVRGCISAALQPLRSCWAGMLCGKEAAETMMCPERLSKTVPQTARLTYLNHCKTVRHDSYAIEQRPGAPAQAGQDAPALASRREVRVRGAGAFHCAYP